MTGLWKMKMFLTLTVLFFLDNGFGAPITPQGRYMWVRCNPDEQNANCVSQRGPLLESIGLPNRLPASAVKDLMNKSPALDGQEVSSQELKEQVEEEEDQRAEEPVQEEDEEEVVDEVNQGDSEYDPNGPKEYGEEEEEDYQSGTVPVLVKPEEEQSGEGSAAGPFLADQGSGEPEYSNSIYPEKAMIDQAIPPVKELKEDLLLL